MSAWAGGCRITSHDKPALYIKINAEYTAPAGRRYHDHLCVVMLLAIVLDIRLVFFSVCLIFADVRACRYAGCLLCDTLKRTTTTIELLPHTMMWVYDYFKQTTRFDIISFYLTVVKVIECTLQNNTIEQDDCVSSCIIRVLSFTAKTPSAFKNSHSV